MPQVTMLLSLLCPKTKWQKRDYTNGIYQGSPLLDAFLWDYPSHLKPPVSVMWSGSLLLACESLLGSATLSASEGFINALMFTSIGGKQRQPDEMVIA